MHSIFKKFNRIKLNKNSWIYLTIIYRFLGFLLDIIYVLYIFIMKIIEYYHIERNLRNNYFLKIYIGEIFGLKILRGFISRRYPIIFDLAERRFNLSILRFSSI